MCGIDNEDLWATGENGEKWNMEKPYPNMFHNVLDLKHYLEADIILQAAE